MTRSPVVQQPLTPTSSPRSAVPAAALLASAGSAAYISTVLIGGELTPRQAFLLPIGVVGSVLATLGCLGLLLVLPRQGWAPRWIVWTIGAALAFVMAQAWATATIVVGLAGTVDDPTFDAVGSSLGLTVLMAPKMALGVIGFAGLSIHGWRSRSMPRGAAALLGLAAIAFVVPPFPPGLLLAGLGMAWAWWRTPPVRP